MRFLIDAFKIPANESTERSELEAAASRVTPSPGSAAWSDSRKTRAYAEAKQRRVSYNAATRESQAIIRCSLVDINVPRRLTPPCRDVTWR
jgi:hypothetical protein